MSKDGIDDACRRTEEALFDNTSPSAARAIEFRFHRQTVVICSNISACLSIILDFLAFIFAFLIERQKMFLRTCFNRLLVVVFIVLIVLVFFLHDNRAYSILKPFLKSVSFCIRVTQNKCNACNFVNLFARSGQNLIFSFTESHQWRDLSLDKLVWS